MFTDEIIQQMVSMMPPELSGIQGAEQFNEQRNRALTAFTNAAANYRREISNYDKAGGNKDIGRWSSDRRFQQYVKAYDEACKALTAERCRILHTPGPEKPRTFVNPASIMFYGPNKTQEQENFNRKIDAFAARYKKTLDSAYDKLRKSQLMPGTGNAPELNRNLAIKEIRADEDKLAYEFERYQRERARLAKTNEQKG